jgi:hypothetical protein
VIRGEDTGREKVTRVVCTSLFIGVRLALKEEILPETGGVDSAVFEHLEREALGVNVVHREEAGNAVLLCEGGNQSCHPVVAVNEVGAGPRDDVVDDLALKRDRGEVTFGPAVDLRAVVEGAIFREVDPAVRFRGGGFREPILE